MFTVLGITGKVGGAVAENLLAAGKTVRGVVRDWGKAKAWADRGVEWSNLRTTMRRGSQRHFQEQRVRSR